MSHISGEDMRRIREELEAARRDAFGARSGTKPERLMEQLIKVLNREARN